MAQEYELDNSIDQEESTANMETTEVFERTQQDEFPVTDRTVEENQNTDRNEENKDLSELNSKHAVFVLESEEAEVF